MFSILFFIFPVMMDMNLDIDHSMLCVNFDDSVTQVEVKFHICISDQCFLSSN